MAQRTHRDRGFRVLCYGEEGMGKTSLAALTPHPTFIDIDDGTARTRNHRDGEPINVVNGVESFADLREALHAPGLWDNTDTIVLDNITVAEKWAHLYMFETIKTEKGQRARSIEDYGFGKGYVHLVETMRLLLQDFDKHVRAGRNVILLSQESTITVSNAEGTDFLQAGPALHHSQKNSVRAEILTWVDAALRIGYLNRSVQTDNVNAKTGKAVGSNDRAIFTMGQPSFKAKPGGTLSEPVVSFEGPDDDSIWQMLFDLGGE